jgi:hypothetical protein
MSPLDIEAVHEALDLLGLEAVEPVEETINHAGIHRGAMGHESRGTGETAGRCDDLR